MAQTDERADRTSIRERGEQARKAHEPPTARSLPNFCNLGITLRLVVLVNLLFLAAAAVRADQGGFFSQYLTISLIGQPAILFSMLAACALRRTFARLSYWQGVALVGLAETGIAVLLWWAVEMFSRTFGSVHPLSLPHSLAFFAFSTAVALVYFDLRARSLAPALTEARLQALQARIRPHFLFNSINAVLSLIRDEPRRAERMLEDMADLFRVLMADNRRLQPLADELALCRQYLDIEHIRLGDRLQVVWRTEQAPLAALVPPLILQPLIENAVYHGIEPLDGPGTLEIDIAAQDKRLTMRLTNPYRAGGTHVSGNRMAIANIAERLQLHFDAEAHLRAQVENDRYIVTIAMPIVENAT